MPFVAGDTGSSLQTTIQDASTNAVIDLTGATVMLRYKIGKAAVKTATMTVSNPSTGVATYAFGVGQLTPGELEYEVVVTDSGGKVLTQVLPGTITVRAKLS